MSPGLPLLKRVSSAEGASQGGHLCVHSEHRDVDLIELLVVGASEGSTSGSICTYIQTGHDLTFDSNLVKKPVRTLSSIYNGDAVHHQRALGDHGGGEGHRRLHLRGGPIGLDQVLKVRSNEQ